MVVIGAAKLQRVSAELARMPSVYLLLQLLFCSTRVMRACAPLPRTQCPCVSEQFMKLLVPLALTLQPQKWVLLKFSSLQVVVRPVLWFIELPI